MSSPPSNYQQGISNQWNISNICSSGKQFLRLDTHTHSHSRHSFKCRVSFYCSLTSVAKMTAGKKSFFLDHRRTGFLRRKFPWCNCLWPGQNNEEDKLRNNGNGCLPLSVPLAGCSATCDHDYWNHNPPKNERRSKWNEKKTTTFTVIIIFDGWLVGWLVHCHAMALPKSKQNINISQQFLIHSFFAYRSVVVYLSSVQGLGSVGRTGGRTWLAHNAPFVKVRMIASRSLALSLSLAVFHIQSRSLSDIKPSYCLARWASKQRSGHSLLESKNGQQRAKEIFMQRKVNEWLWLCISGLTWIGMIFTGFVGCINLSLLLSFCTLLNKKQKKICFCIFFPASFFWDALLGYLFNDVVYKIRLIF